MDPFTQFIQSIPGLSGSMQQINRRTIEQLEASGQGHLIPEFIRQQETLGWI